MKKRNERIASSQEALMGDVQFAANLPGAGVTSFNCIHSATSEYSSKTLSDRCAKCFKLAVREASFEGGKFPNW
jgi:hypothetical protein